MLDIVTINERADNANTYIVGNEQEVIIIDPANRLSSIVAAIKGRKVLGVLLTHAHYDHFKTLIEVLEKYNVKCYIHKKAYEKLNNITSSCAMFFGINALKNVSKEQVVFISDNEIINILFNIKVITTPGHTDCSVVYDTGDVMFTGDTLFNNGVGRTDLPTSNTITLINSLKKLLDNNIQRDIYPGHGLSSTLEEERKYNDFYKRIR